MKYTFEKRNAPNDTALGCSFKPAGSGFLCFWGSIGKILVALKTDLSFNGSMNKFLLVALFFLVSDAFSAELFTPTDVFGVKSEVSRDKTGKETIYRATIFCGSKEGSATLGLEKYLPGEYGAPTKVLQQKKFIVPGLQGFKPFIDKIAQRSVEATYGYCGLQNLEWTKDKKVTFDIKYSDRIFNKGFIERDGKKVDTAQYSHTEVSIFHCQSSSLENSEPKIACEKVHTEKVENE